jgi:hypothetical protein
MSIEAGALQQDTSHEIFAAGSYQFMCGVVVMMCMMHAGKLPACYLPV